MNYIGCVWKFPVNTPRVYLPSHPPPACCWWLELVVNYPQRSPPINQLPYLLPTTRLLTQPLPRQLLEQVWNDLSRHHHVHDASLPSPNPFQPPFSLSLSLSWRDENPLIIKLGYKAVVMQVHATECHVVTSERSNYSGHQLSCPSSTLCTPQPDRMASRSKAVQLSGKQHPPAVGQLCV